MRCGHAFIAPLSGEMIWHPCDSVVKAVSDEQVQGSQCSWACTKGLGMCSKSCSWTLKKYSWQIQLSPQQLAR